jgi:hypothetical protein
MTWTTTGDPDAFLDAAGAFLRAGAAISARRCWRGGRRRARR